MRGRRLHECRAPAQKPARCHPTCLMPQGRGRFRGESRCSAAELYLHPRAGGGDGGRTRGGGGVLRRSLRRSATATAGASAPPLSTWMITFAGPPRSTIFCFRDVFPVAPVCAGCRMARRPPFSAAAARRAGRASYSRRLPTDILLCGRRSSSFETGKSREFRQRGGFPEEHR